MMNTLDVDWRRLPNGYVFSSEELLKIIEGRLEKCPFRLDPSYSMVRSSASMNGYHIKIVCRRKHCDRCRLVFDSPTRFAADMGRPEHSRDVVWDRKVYRKGNNKIVGEAGSWF